MPVTNELGQIKTTTTKSTHQTNQFCHKIKSELRIATAGSAEKLWHHEERNKEGETEREQMYSQALAGNRGDTSRCFRREEINGPASPKPSDGN